MMLHNSIKLPFQAFVDKCKQAKFLGFTHGLFSSLNDTDTKNNKNGQVIILGAGPGDAELMTIKGLKALQNADVVLFDWLVSSEVLALIPPQVEKMFVGKRCGKHSMPQASICDLVVEQALMGKKVVRLKGGDPAIFARTLEETQLIAQHNIPFCIIPGITAASGASAYTGLTLTHRECAQSVRYVTASLKTLEDEPNWQQIVNNCETETLVFYMGLSKLALIAERLMEAGVSADFPIAVIDKACSVEQQMVTGNLKNIAANEQVKTFTGPAIIVVGRVIDHHQAISINPMTMQPLTASAIAL